MPDMLAFNEFSEDVEFLKPAPWHSSQEITPNWTDDDTARCQYYLSKERKFDPQPGMILAALSTVARQKNYHPIKQYLESIKWDGFPRLATWVPKYLGADDTPYTRNVGLKILVAAVNRIYEPGCKFDYIPVLEGIQGLGKSTAISILGGKWYGTMTIDVHSRDTIDVMRHLWMIEVDEMEVQFRTDTQALRAFLSRGSDITRLAYARSSKEFPRHNVFIGTLNPEFDTDIGWLKDTTGNRRFWPVLCNKIDLDILRKCRDQLWAEAYLYYKAHTAIHFDDVKIEEEAAIEQMKRMGKDPWFDSVALYVAANPEREIFSGMDIYKNAVNGQAERYNRISQLRISTIMRMLDWEKGKFYDPMTQISTNGFKYVGIK
jgi:putative DNA primase/helicase